MYIVQCMYMLQSVGFQSPKMIQPNAQCASTFELEFRETETSTVSLKTLFTASYLWHSPISDASLFVTPTVLVSGAHLFLTPNSFWHLQYLFKTTTYRYFRHPTISDTYLVPIYGTHLFLTPVLYLFLMPTYFWDQYCTYFWCSSPRCRMDRRCSHSRTEKHKRIWTQIFFSYLDSLDAKFILDMERSPRLFLLAGKYHFYCMWFITKPA